MKRWLVHIDAMFLIRTLEKRYSCLRITYLLMGDKYLIVQVALGLYMFRDDSEFLDLFASTFEVLRLYPVPPCFASSLR